MPSPGTKLCEVCNLREATCHLTQINDDRQQSLDLCAGCYEAREPLGEKQLRQAAAAPECEYCGGQPCVDWHSLTNIFASVANAGQTRFLCGTCSVEYNRFLAERFETLQRDLTEEEGLAALRELRERAHGHMLEWLARKKS